MADDIARLGMVFETQGAQAANAALDQVATKSAAAEKATDSLAQSQNRAKSATQQMAEQINQTMAVLNGQATASNAVVAANAKMGASAKAAAQDFATLYDASKNNFAAQWAAGAATFVSANENMHGSSKRLSVQQQELMHSVRAMTDGLIAGIPPTQLLGMEMGRLGQIIAGGGLLSALKELGAMALPFVPWAVAAAGLVTVIGFIVEQFQSASEEAKKFTKLSNDFSETQRKSLDAMSSAIEYAGKYHVASEELWTSLEGVLKAQGATNDIVKMGKGATEEMARAARDRAEAERLLTIELLKQAAAQERLRATEAQKQLSGLLPSQFGTLVRNVGEAAAGQDVVGHTQEMQQAMSTPMARQLKAIVDEANATANALDKEAKAWKDAQLVVDVKGPHGSRGPQDHSDSTLDAAQKAQLAAQLGLTKDIEEQAALKHAEIATELKAQEDQVARALKEKSITADAAKIADGYYEAAAALKDQAVERDKQFALAAAALAQEQAVNGYLDRRSTAEAAMAATAEQANKFDADILARKQKAETDALAEALTQQVALKQVSEAEAFERLTAQKQAQAAETALAEWQARVKVIHEAAEVETSHLEVLKAGLEAQQSLARSDVASAILGKEILVLQQQIQLAKAQEAIDAAKPGSTEQKIAEDQMKILKIQQAAETELAKRETDASHVFKRMSELGTDLADAIARHDWATVFDDLQKAIEAARVAFSSAGTPASRVGAVAGLGNIVGQAIGGKAGKAISDASNVGLTTFAITGNPVIAALAAAVAGIVDLLKREPSNFTATATFGPYGAISLGGDKPNADTLNAAQQVAQAIEQGMQQLQALGLTLGTTVTSLAIGSRDTSKIHLSNGQTIEAPAGDATAAAEAALKAVLEGATFADQAEQKLVKSMLDAGAGFDQVTAAIQAYASAQQVSTNLADQILQLSDPEAYDLKAVKEAIAQQRDAAKEMADAGYLTAAQLSEINGQLDTLQGLQIDQVMKKYADAVDQTTAQLQQQIEAKRSDIQSQIDELTLTPDQLLAQQRADEMAATVALDASLGPLLQHLYDLQDAATAAAAAQQAAADAQQAATAAAQQAAQLQATNDNLMIRLAQTQGDTATATLLTRQQELASATDESTKAILRQIYAAEDQAAANNAAAAAQQQAAQDAAAAQQAAAQLAATNENLMIRLAQAQGDTATATRLSREQELAAATDESTKAILRQIYAAEDLKAAQDAAAAAQDAAAKAAQAHADAVTAAVQKATDAQTELQRAYDAQVQLLQGVISKNRDLVASLKSYESGLSASSGGAAGLQQQAQAARAQFLSLADAAIGGDSTAAGQLTGASDAYLKLAQQIAATPLAYSRAVAEVRSYIDRVKSEAEKTADVAQEQLDTLNKQVDGLVTINSSLLTIDQQIANGFAALTAALDAYRAASQSALGVMGVSGGTAPNGYTFDVAGDTALDGSGVWYQKLPDGSVIRHDIGTANALFGNVPTGAAFDAMMAQAAQNIAAAQAQSKHILGIPGFAAGGWFSGGLRLVGEYGPEIEATGAARYWDAAQTSAMLGGAANDDLAAEVADLKERLGNALDRIEKHVAATAKSVDDQNKMGVWARGQQPGDAVSTAAA